MNQIKCPHCGTVFTINEADYSSIVSQIKDHTFQEELSRREAAIREKLEMENVLAASKKEETYKEALEKQKQEYEKMQHTFALKESEYKAQISANEETMNSAVRVAQVQSVKEMNDKLHEAEMQIESLKNQLSAANTTAKMNLENVIVKKDQELAKLRSEIDKGNTERELAVEKAIHETTERKNVEIQRIQKDLEETKTSAQISTETLRAKLEEVVKNKDREIEDQKALVQQYKDFKVRLSTKMIGESLEQHCSYEFNKNRMGMFPRAYFEKDNDARTGSKGDFIFRDYDEDGTEIISIMFEMKNENETTASKHKNEDFFKELDKDRREKNCEFAVLVSMLESDNDLYNEGIVDVSYKYPKMYVIRPQFFIPIITLLRNASMNALAYKKQLVIEKNNNLDLTNFEDNMNRFKDAFGKNYATASKKFNEAIDEIDKSISHLQKIKDALTSSDRQLRLANDKAQELTIRKLTKNAPSVKEKLEEVKKIQELGKNAK